MKSLLKLASVFSRFGNRQHDREAYKNSLKMKISIKAPFFGECVEKMVR